jgi:hypothetical protein
MDQSKSLLAIGCLILLHVLPLPRAHGEDPARPSGPPQPARTLDVTLAEDHALVGKLVDSQGNPLAGARITAHQTNRPAIVTTADRDGNFRLAQAKAGVYTLGYQDRSVILRAWTQATAPPAAKPGVLLVSGEVERGQLGGFSPLAGSLSAQAFAVGVLAAAVAIPVAIGLNDDPSGS